MTTVRIFNTNTDKVIAADVKTEGARLYTREILRSQGTGISFSYKVKIYRSGWNP